MTEKERMMNLKKYTQYYAGSLTNINEDKIEKFLNNANEKRKNKRLEKLHISISPKLISKELVKLLKANDVITIELEIKIANNFILKKCEYDYTVEDIKKASKIIRRNRVNVGYQLIVGLPDSTRIDEYESAKFLMKFRPSFIRIYPVLIVEGTELETAFRNDEYEPLTLQQGIERCKELIYLFNKKRIKSISLSNLNENVKENKEGLRIIAGPNHQAFPQLVEDSIWYDSIVSKIKKYNSKVKEVKVEVHPSNISNVIGYEKENLKRIKDTYSVEMQVTANDQIKPGRSEMKILTIYED